MSRYTNIVSAILMLVFTLSTTGIVMNKHKCKGNVKGVSAFVQPEQCEHSEQATKQVPKCHQKQEKEKKKCCENDSEQLKNTEQSLTYHKISIEKELVLTAAIYAFSPDFSGEKTVDKSSTYEQPPPKTQRQLLHKIYEQYLI